MPLLDVLTPSVAARRGFAVRTRDGEILRTDHYASRAPDAPTVLVRTPYGRGGLTAAAARLFARHGFHVVVSSCRGTGGSTGGFDPMRHERDDGLDTVDWLRRQPWFTGRLGTFGVSYVGYTQWAIADVPEIAAMATAVTSSQFREPTYSGESFALYTTLAWASLIQAQAGPWLPNAVELLRGQPRLRAALSHLPLGEADRLATGAEVAFFQRWLALAGSPGAAADEYWGPMDHQHRLDGTGAAVLMVGGWHDIFLPWQLRDYARLRAAGARPHLTVGPWTHGSLGLAATTMRESLTWLRHHLRGEGRGVRSRPVRLHVGGAGWREYDDWPPPVETARPWYLGPDGGLAPVPPSAPTVDTFRYDPSDPTPSVGGPLLVANVAGVRDNRALEARPDVLVYTSDALDRDVEVVGPVAATVYVGATRPHFDLFVRLCDVEPSGRSLNVCDGLAKVTPGRFPEDGDGAVAVSVDLWPTAHRFGAGHRLRVQVSGGAFPRYPRGTGTPDPLSSATDLQPVELEIHHAGSHLLLPIA